MSNESIFDFILLARVHKSSTSIVKISKESILTDFRAIGSDPSQVTFLEIQLMKIGWIFWFRPYTTVPNCIMCINCTFQQKVNLPSFLGISGVPTGVPFGILGVPLLISRIVCQLFNTKINWSWIKNHFSFCSTWTSQKKTVRGYAPLNAESPIVKSERNFQLENLLIL